MREILVLNQTLLPDSEALFFSILPYLENDHLVCLKGAYMAHLGPIAPCEQNSVEAYLRAHQDGPVYVSNLSYLNVLIASVALLQIQQPVYVLKGVNHSTGEVIFQNIQPLSLPYLTSWQFGVQGLDTRRYPYADQGRLYFDWNGQRHFFRKDAAIFPELRIKLYSQGLYYHEVNRLQALIHVSQHFPQHAFPLALIYNQEKMPVGVVTRQFHGAVVTSPTPEQFIRLIQEVQVLSIWGIYDLDFVFCDDGQIHLFNIDEAQYLDFPSRKNHFRFINAMDLGEALLSYGKRFDLDVRLDGIGALVSLDELAACVQHDHRLNTVSATKVVDEKIKTKIFIPQKSRDIEEKRNIDGKTKAPDHLKNSEMPISPLQKYLLALFLRNAKTALADENDAQRWKRLIRERQYIYPLVYLGGSSFVILLIVVALLW